MSEESKSIALPGPRSPEAVFKDPPQWAADPKHEIAHLKSRKESLILQLQDVNAALDKYRVKCPTCRCRILPETTCACCADSTVVDVESPI
jgi:hypothetical protein